MRPLRLYVGADAQNVQGRRLNLTGYRCFSAAYGPKSRFAPEEADSVVGMLDSGAFSYPPERRPETPALFLESQLRWEANARRLWNAPDWAAESFVSGDLLIDEKWHGKERHKQRWTVREADRAVRVTVEAAAYLARQRRRLAPRGLILATQGVDGAQYEDCARAVLAHAAPEDVIGLGGWCVLGRRTRWMDTFWAAMRRTLPLVASAGLTRVHVFGVLYRPALGGLLWLCDELGLSLSTDSSRPVRDPACRAPSQRKKAGALADTWEANVAATLALLAGLRESEHYRDPPRPHGARQIALFEE